jgi:hypothetical protein
LVEVGEANVDVVAGGVEGRRWHVDDQIADDGVEDLGHADDGFEVSFRHAVELMRESFQALASLPQTGPRSTAAGPVGRSKTT